MKGLRNKPLATTFLGIVLAALALACDAGPHENTPGTAPFSWHDAGDAEPRCEKVDGACKGTDGCDRADGYRWTGDAGCVVYDPVLACRISTGGPIGVTTCGKDDAGIVYAYFGGIPREVRPSLVACSPAEQEFMQGRAPRCP